MADSKKESVTKKVTTKEKETKTRSYDRISLDFLQLVSMIKVHGGDRVSNQTSKADIVAYLADVKRLLSAGKYDFVPRRKNMQALAQY